MIKLDYLDSLIALEVDNFFLMFGVFFFLITLGLSIVLSDKANDIFPKILLASLLLSSSISFAIYNAQIKDANDLYTKSLNKNPLKIKEINYISTLINSKELLIKEFNDKFLENSQKILESKNEFGWNLAFINNLAFILQNKDAKDKLCLILNEILEDENIEYYEYKWFKIKIKEVAKELKSNKFKSEREKKLKQSTKELDKNFKELLENCKSCKNKVSK